MRNDKITKNSTNAKLLQTIYQKNINQQTSNMHIYIAAYLYSYSAVL